MSTNPDRKKMMIAEKPTAKVLVAALKSKYIAKKAAVLAEVTMDDEQELARYRTAQARRRPALREYFESEGLSCDEELPVGYRLKDAITQRRIDALIFESKMLTAVEVKVSRADFFRDTDAKRGAWFRHTHRFVYLVPKGLVKMEEVPDGCGLWEYEAGQITVTKKSKINKTPLPFPFSMTKYFAWRAFIAERKLASRRGY